MSATAMLTQLSSTPTRIVLRQVWPATPIITARWITKRPRWLPVSWLDTATLAPEPEPSVGHQHSPRFSPPDWQREGLCSLLPAQVSDALFFGIEVREAPGRLIAAANAARQICARCPVAGVCLTSALVEDERYGVWGGTSGRQREKLRIRLAAGATVADLVAECLPGGG